MISIDDQILVKIKKAKGGSLFFIDDFVAFGNAKAVGKAMERLVKSGELHRVAKGIYVRPVKDKVLGIVLPGIEDIAEAIRKRDKARIVPTGSYALYKLGLTTQVPMKVVYYTDSTARTVRIGKQTITFKRASARNVSAIGDISKLAIQALRSIGKGKVRDEEINRIRELLRHEKPYHLQHDLKLAPEWIRKLLKPQKLQHSMPDFTHLKEWLNLPDETKLNIFTETGRNKGLYAIAIEKDWWVVHTIALIYTMDCARSLVFKGGTSLSKGWNLIQRFSEDIDLALDREYLGFIGELENADVRRLRRASYDYMTTTFTEELRTKFKEAGFTDVTVKYREVANHDQDPMIIEIYYPKLTEKETYLKPGVLVEVGSRSLIEPFTDRTFATMAAENYPNQPFSDKPITIPTVNPERTFLEKIFLLYEEFQKPEEKRRVDGLSRHLYDIEILSRTEFAEIALNDADLYSTIVTHRSKFSRISGVDFANHSPDKICFIPPEHLLSEWQADYKLMQENMIYGEALPYSELIKKLKELQSRINIIQWN